MNKKIYRRFLFALIMLLMTVSLTFTGPGQQAAVFETCEACQANCHAIYDACLASGTVSPTICANRLLQCNKACFYDGCIVE
jgi:hypothetical protein